MKLLFNHDVDVKNSQNKLDIYLHLKNLIMKKRHDTDETGVLCSNFEFILNLSKRESDHNKQQSTK